MSRFKDMNRYNTSVTKREGGKINLTQAQVAEVTSKICDDIAKNPMAAFNLFWKNGVRRDVVRRMNLRKGKRK